VSGPGHAAGPADRPGIGDPGRIDRQKTWPRIVTGAVIACLTPADLLAAGHLVHDILTDNSCTPATSPGCWPPAG
jgi:hypothetical protein